jgi:glycosyltransferase involved in cell wall biosynthesis
MTTIVINAVSVREGGSLVVLRELLPLMVQARADWHWHVVTNAETSRQLPACNNVTYHVYQEQELASWRIRLWYESVLPRLLATTNADLLFSQTNYLPARRLPCPSLLLVQHAGHFSTLFCRLTAAQTRSWRQRLGWRLKGHWVRASVRRASQLTVQTQALAQAIALDIPGVTEKLTVIAHGSGMVRPDIGLPQRPVIGQPLRIGYITKFGVQKNFTVLFAAAARLQAQGRALVLVLTLDTAKLENQRVLAHAQQLGVSALIENHGELSSGEIAKLYRSLHCFVFASLCESFGFPLVEAMAYGLPLLIADTASNREVAGTAGEFFGSGDAHTLGEQLARLAQDEAWYLQLVRRSQLRAADFSWEKSALANLQLIESTLARQSRQ